MVWRGGLVFLVFFAPLPLLGSEADGRSGDVDRWARRELNEVMNSRAAGESPRRFFRWSALASLERVAV